MVASRAVVAGVLTAILAMGALAYRAETVVGHPPGDPYAPAFRGQVRGPGALLNAHDGQAFGSLALDPLLTRPDTWGGGANELAFRASRPLLGWLIGLTSLGSRQAAAWSTLVWTAIGLGLLAVGAVMLARVWGRPTDWVPLLLLLPGVVGQLLFGGMADGLGTGLALIGMAWWLQHRDGRAVAVLCLAALCRENMLIVPLALMLAADRRRAVRLLVPFAAYAGWVAVVWLRLHALPIDAGHGRLGAPFAGLVAEVGGWTWLEALSVTSVAVLSIVAWRRAPSAEVRWLVGLSAVFASTMGPEIWSAWDVGRILLPVTVVGACLLARPVSSGARRHQRGADEGTEHPEGRGDVEQRASHEEARHGGDVHRPVHVGDGAAGPTS